MPNFTFFIKVDLKKDSFSDAYDKSKEVERKIHDSFIDLSKVNVVMLLQDGIGIAEPLKKPNIDQEKSLANAVRLTPGQKQIIYADPALDYLGTDSNSDSFSKELSQASEFKELQSVFEKASREEREALLSKIEEFLEERKENG